MLAHCSLFALLLSSVLAAPRGATGPGLEPSPGGPIVAKPSSLAGPEFKPNILVIIMDDIGSDQLEMYDVANCGVHQFRWPGSPDDNPDHRYANTPTLNSIAESGVRFNWAFASPTCSPTRAQFLTGRYPFRTGIGGIVEPNGAFERVTNGANLKILQQLDLPLAETTVPEIMGEAGYATGYFGKWHLARDDSRGFGVISAYPGTAFPAPGGVPAIPSKAHPALSGWSLFSGIMGNPNNSPSPNNSFFPDHICNTTSGPECPRNDYYGWINVEAIPSPLPQRDDAIWGASVISDNSVVGGEIVPGEAAFITTVQRQQVEAWIESTQPNSLGQGGRPFLAVWAASAPHGPYSASPSALIPNTNFPVVSPLVGTLFQNAADRFFWVRYQNLIESLDTEIGNLKASLEFMPGRLPGDSTVWDETVVLIVGDNGTPRNLQAEKSLEQDAMTLLLSEVNRIHPYDLNDADGLARFKASPFMTGTAVPLIASGFGVDSEVVPGGICPGGTVGGRVDNDSIVEVVDFFSTLLDVGGVTIPVGLTVDGVSFAPSFLAAGNPSPEPTALSMRYSPNGDPRCAVALNFGFTARFDRSLPMGSRISNTGPEIFRIVRVTNYLACTSPPTCSVDKLYRVHRFGAADPADVREEDGLLVTPGAIQPPLSMSDAMDIYAELKTAAEAAIGSTTCSCSSYAPSGCMSCPPPNPNNPPIPPNLSSPPCPSHSSL